MMERSRADLQPEDQFPVSRLEENSEPGKPIWQTFSEIFTTGLSEIKRKSAITRLNFEIKSIDKEKEKFFQTLGTHAWEAHVEHPDMAGIIVHLKEIQIEMNRLENQAGEHETQIEDIEMGKAEQTEKFNTSLDEFDQRIVPHRQKIESINAEKENNKIQVEELRTKQDGLSVQVRFHQKNIQDLDLGPDPEKEPKISLEKGAIRGFYDEKCEIECRLPFLHSKMEKLKMALAAERAEIETQEQEKEITKRNYEQRMKDYNQEIHELEEK